MKRKLRIGIAASLAIAFSFAGAVAPAYAATITLPGRSCNSGYEAQTAAYHDFTVTHGQYTGASWFYTNKTSGNVFKWSYDGVPSQSFTSGVIIELGGDATSTGTRCV
jgi:hypothetical protein